MSPALAGRFFTTESPGKHKYKHIERLKAKGWSIYPEKTLIQKDTCTPVFTAALFTTAKTWKQPQGPSTEEMIYKMWYLYTMEYYLAIKNEIMPSAT